MEQHSQARPTPKPWIDAIDAYVPGQARGGDGRDLVKLSANENPLGCSKAALAALAEPFNPAFYPDPDAMSLRKAIAEVHGLDPARIVCAAGSGDLLGLAVQAYAGPGDEVLYSRFSFSLYEIVARRSGAAPVEAPDTDYATDVDALLAHVTPATKVVFVANPNNPTGTYLPASEIARLHAGLPAQVLLVLDQAYAEFLTDKDTADGGFALAQRHENVLVTRTFSKIYGLAGERIGWATGAPGVIADLNRIRGPFNVAQSSQMAALAALGDQAFVQHTCQHNAREMTRLVAVIDSLGNHGLRAVPSKANFLLVLFEGAVTAQQALHGLAEAGYAVRWLPGQGLSHGLRITIGTTDQMDDVAYILRALVEGD